MINISKSDINKLELIGHGGFGDVYKKGNLIYKLYRKEVPTGYCTYVKNPSLKYHPFKLRRLMNLDKKIMYSDLIKDVIFVDGKFGGVVNKYYDGLTLTFANLSFDEKIRLSYSLLKSVRELVSNNIYPLDLKLDNIMAVSGQAKLIDLDDYYTKLSFFQNPIFEKKCFSMLNTTIKAFLNEYNTFYNWDLYEHIEKGVSTYNCSFEGITSYLKDKSIKYSYVILSDESDIYSHIKLFRNSKYRILYAKRSYLSYNDLVDYIHKLNDMNIYIYDVVLKRKIDVFFENISYDEVFEVKGDSLVRKL